MEKGIQALVVQEVFEQVDGESVGSINVAEKSVDKSKSHTQRTIRVCIYICICIYIYICIYVYIYILYIYIIYIYMIIFVYNICIYSTFIQSLYIYIYM